MVTLAGAGVAMVIAGAVMLVRLGWIGLALWLGPLWATGLVGGLLVGSGALSLALVSRPKRPRPQPDPLGLAAAAFFQGMATGRSVRR